MNVFIPENLGDFIGSTGLYLFIFNHIIQNRIVFLTYIIFEKFKTKTEL